jgi:hypothetical protein
MMSQHFLLSAKARSLSLSQVLRLTDDQAYETFKAVRWAGTEGKPFCAKCGSVAVYEYKARRIFKCKGCTAQFSVTSGTIFASRKMAHRDLLAAIAIFVNGAKAPLLDARANHARHGGAGDEYSGQAAGANRREACRFRASPSPQQGAD